MEPQSSGVIFCLHEKNLRSWSDEVHGIKKNLGITTRIHFNRTLILREWNFRVAFCAGAHFIFVALFPGHNYDVSFIHYLYECYFYWLKITDAIRLNLLCAETVSILLCKVGWHDMSWLYIIICNKQHWLPKKNIYIHIKIIHFILLLRRKPPLFFSKQYVDLHTRIKWALLLHKNNIVISNYKFL